MVHPSPFASPDNVPAGLSPRMVHQESYLWYPLVHKRFVHECPRPASGVFPRQQLCSRSGDIPIKPAEKETRPRPCQQYSKGVPSGTVSLCTPMGPYVPTHGDRGGRGR